ncbi:MAP kinase-activated protein kinase 2-like [Littorina saxatilis]|uniref:MAP kinase-activated protein kinase 2-like n=1 Tax=Littorina saxatilis TaxID=31220 RepID=UPI0038B6B139
MSHFRINTIQPNKQPVADDYILTETVLGVGGRGKVLECHSRKTNQKFALKVLKKDEHAIQQLNLHWKACYHPNGNHIVHIQDVYEDIFAGERCLLVIMECMEGGPLLTRIQERTDFTEREAAEIIHGIVSVIGHLHSQGIAHRNLKPESLMFTDTTPAAVLKLGGFGFATEFAIGKPASPCYTPALQSWESPEMLRRAKYEKSCDLWSIGVIMYILLCGYPPFQGKAEAAISPWMKAMGHHSQYEFSDPEWSRVSSEGEFIYTFSRVFQAVKVVKHHSIKTEV